MKKVLVTGSDGFLGRNLCVSLERCEDVKVLRFDRRNSDEDLEKHIAQADFCFHLAGVNRPRDEKEFTEGNAGLTRRLCELAENHESCAPILLSSSSQADQDNAYGSSKKAAETALIAYSQRTGVPVMIYRFPNLFGKWSRPNYNSVVSTFCYNIAHDMDVQVNDPSHVVQFAHVDDAVTECLTQMNRSGFDESIYYELTESYVVALGDLCEKIRAFHAIRKGSPVPDLSDPFTKKLYSTFLSYYEMDDLAYPVDLKTDNRGWLFELVKSNEFGQIFVSTTHPGITRGNHYHDTKVEKFCVIQGRGIVRFRHILENEFISYEVSGREIKIIDIPPGYTHSIENIGDTEMVTLFWANDIFDPGRPDTYYEEVQGNRA